MQRLRGIRLQDGLHGVRAEAGVREGIIPPEDQRRQEEQQRGEQRERPREQGKAALPERYRAERRGRRERHAEDCREERESRYGELHPDEVQRAQQDDGGKGERADEPAAEERPRRQQAPGEETQPKTACECDVIG